MPASNQNVIVNEALDGELWGYGVIFSGHYIPRVQMMEGFAQCCLAAAP